MELNFLIHINDNYRQDTGSGGGPSQQQQQPSTQTSNNSKAGKLLQAANSSHKVTEYFPIRRSERKPKAEIMKAEMESILSYLNISEDSQHGIEVAAIENKGRGVKVRKKNINFSI